MLWKTMQITLKRIGWGGCLLQTARGGMKLELNAGPCYATPQESCAQDSEFKFRAYGLGFLDIFVYRV